MIRVLYFSILRERIGPEEEIEFSGSVAQLRELLSKRHPHVGEILQRVKFAVNEEYVTDDFTLKGDETVAVIPPVSGG